MNNRYDPLKYSRISGGYHHQCDYEDSTVVIPKRNILLPSIYEINSDQRFPNRFSLNDFICKEYHNDLMPAKEETTSSTFNQSPMSDDNEIINNRIFVKKEQITSPANEYNLSTAQYKQQDYNPQQINNNQQFQHCSQTYNNKDLQFYNNANLDQRYFIQYQIPYNSMISQISDEINSPFMEKTNIIEIHPPQNNQNTNLNFLTLQNRNDDHSRIILDPVELKFIPADQWTRGKVTLEKLKKEFFCARSSKCLRFEYKLWNALQITKHYPYLFSEIGVRWVAKSYIMVHRDIFGHLLQVTRPSAALFSSCGMFMTHGFREILLSEVKHTIDPREMASIDESIVRLFAHKANDFNEESGAEDIIKIKWNNESRKKAEKW